MLQKWWWATGAVPALGMVMTLATPTAAQQGMVVPRVEPTIRVTGMGEVSVMPDEARLQFAVETFAETAREAGAQNATTMEQVVEALVGAGVPRREIQTSNYSLHPEYVHDERAREARIRGYRAANQVSLTTMELERVGALIDVALGAGANRVDAVSFGLRDSAEAEAEALRRAALDARASAETLASALGVTLGAVLDASTTADVYRPMPVMMMRDVAEAAMAPPPPPTPIQPGEQTVRAQASVVFGIAGGR